MLLECHIKTTEHPIPIVVLARHAGGHLGIMIRKLASNERSDGKTEPNRPIKLILCIGWGNGLADYDTAEGQRRHGLGVIAVRVIKTQRCTDPRSQIKFGLQTRPKHGRVWGVHNVGLFEAVTIGPTDGGTSSYSVIQVAFDVRS